MVRFLLWLIIIFIVVKLGRIVINVMQQGRRYDGGVEPPPSKSAPRFEDIQDAEFEDLTPPKVPDPGVPGPPDSPQPPDAR